MPDTFTIRMVVAFLGVTILACVAGGITLAIHQLPTPDFLVAIGSGSLGALGGLLINPGNNRVTVENDARNPVPTEDV